MPRPSDAPERREIGIRVVVNIAHQGLKRYILLQELLERPGNGRRGHGKVELRDGRERAHPTQNVEGEAEAVLR